MSISSYGISRIATERTRQKHEKRYDAKHDDLHTKGELAAYATFFAIPPNHELVELARRFIPDGWAAPILAAIAMQEPTEVEAVERRMTECAKAGALLAAEIDRLQRKRVALLKESSKEPL